jgi:hypothetical protein
MLHYETLFVYVLCSKTRNIFLVLRGLFNIPFSQANSKNSTHFGKAGPSRHVLNFWASYAGTSTSQTLTTPLPTSSIHTRSKKIPRYLQSRHRPLGTCSLLPHVSHIHRHPPSLQRAPCQKAFRSLRDTLLTLESIAALEEMAGNPYAQAVVACLEGLVKAEANKGGSGP